MLGRAAKAELREVGAAVMVLLKRICLLYLFQNGIGVPFLDLFFSIYF